MEICLEDLGRSTPDERYLRCVALPGGEPGLALDGEGAVRWMPQQPTAYGLWVSADDRLVLIRSQGAGPITVSRAGRKVEAPEGKPVLLLDGDLLAVNGRQLRVHVHGPAVAVHRPEPLRGAALARVVRAAAAALAVGAAVGSVAGPGAASAAPPIEIRQNPPGAPARQSVVCNITGMTPGKKGTLLLYASCPGPVAIGVGSLGYILGADGGPIKDGSVTVTQIQGTKVTASTQLRKPVKATKVHFFER